MTLFGFELSRPKELDYADEADGNHFLQGSAIRILEYKIRDSRYNLLGYGVFFLFMYAVWVLTWPTLVRAEWFFTLSVNLLTAMILAICVIRFAVTYQDRRAYRDVLFIKRLTWVD